MKNLPINNVPDDLAATLEEEARQRGASLNQTVIELLSQRVGAGSTRSNGLRRLAGSWTEEEFREFEEAVAGVERANEGAEASVPPRCWTAAERDSGDD